MPALFMPGPCFYFAVTALSNERGRANISFFLTLRHRHCYSKKPLISQSKQEGRKGRRGRLAAFG
jgi:hypothetical protein